VTAPIEAISAAASILAPTVASAPIHTDAAPTTTFAAMMHPVAQANADLNVATASLDKMARGEPVEIHDVMIDLERARLDVLTVIQVRNKALEVYQDLMRMQV
jgi:flagellar hook-basal body complex protein FliE